MSRRSLVSIDYEKGGETTLLELRGDGRVFTSIDKAALLLGSTHMPVLTTYEVMWIDESLPGRPALSWSHDYGSGSLRDLELSHGLEGDEGGSIHPLSLVHED